MDIEHQRENNNILIHGMGTLQGKSFISFPNNFSSFTYGVSEIPDWNISNGAFYLFSANLF